MENLLQGIGLFVCIGAILLVGLAFLARRALASRNNPRDDRSIWTERGKERPRHDTRDIGTSGGFGNAPTSRTRPEGRQAGSPPSRGSGFGGGSTGRTSGRSSGLGSAPRQQPRRERDDDDDVRSSGGFGGG
jgi:hypothetical protein